MYIRSVHSAIELHASGAIACTVYRMAVRRVAILNSVTERICRKASSAFCERFRPSLGEARIAAITTRTSAALFAPVLTSYRHCFRRLDVCFCVSYLRRLYGFTESGVWNYSAEYECKQIRNECQTKTFIASLAHIRIYCVENVTCKQTDSTDIPSVNALIASVITKTLRY